MLLFTFLLKGPDQVQNFPQTVTTLELRYLLVSLIRNIHAQDNSCCYDDIVEHA